MGKGRHHNQAICAVASNLAGRTFSVMRHTGLGTETLVENTVDVCYVVRYFQGQRIDRKEARALVKERFPSNKERESAHNFYSRQSLPTNQDNFSLVSGQTLPADNYTKQ